MIAIVFCSRKNIVALDVRWYYSIGGNQEATYHYQTTDLARFRYPVPLRATSMIAALLKSSRTSQGALKFGEVTMKASRWVLKIAAILVRKHKAKIYCSQHGQNGQKGKLIVVDNDKHIC